MVDVDVLIFVGLSSRVIGGFNLYDPNSALFKLHIHTNHKSISYLDMKPTKQLKQRHA